jgi:hypothetical protein
MQIVSSDFLAAASGSFNEPSFYGKVSWTKTHNDTAGLFVLDSSILDGSDLLEGTGEPITFFDQYEYSEESANIVGFTIDRTISTIPIGVMSAQLDIEFDNTSKRYLPGFDPDIGSLIKNGRPIKVGVGFNSEILQQFVGISGRPKNGIIDRSTNLHAFDGMEYISKFESSLGLQTDILVDDLMGLLLQELGFGPSQYVIERSLQNKLPFVAPSGQKTGELLRLLAEAEGGIIFFDEQGVFRFWNRLHLSSDPTIVSTISYDNSTDMKYIDTPILNHVRVTSKPRQLAENQPVFVLSRPIELQAGEVLRYPISFSDSYGDLPTANLTTPIYGYTANLSHFTANESEDGEGVDLAGSVTVTDFDDLGKGAVVEFTNGSSDVAYVTLLEIWGQPAKVVATYQEEWKDQTSIDDNGVNPDNGGVVYEVNNDFIQSRAAALSYAQSMVMQYGDGKQQISIDIFPNPAWQFGDAFNVFNEDTGITKRMVLLSNVISMQPNMFISQSLILEEREYVHYFTLDVSQLDGPDLLAP